MKIKLIKQILEASLIYGEDFLNNTVDNVYASDLMSDVLAFGKPDSILLTGLATQQAVISAHMAAFKGVVFIRNKKPKDGSKNFSIDHNLVLLSTHFDMFDSCIKINSVEKGLSITLRENSAKQKVEEILLNQNFFINGKDFASAGMTSTEIKSILKKIGLKPELIRRVAISTYEAEMNVVMHAEKANVILTITPKHIQVTVDDKGKGIPDVKLALQEGFTTATDEMRAMGFGSGMGLPNIKKNSDEINIDSDVGKGTKLQIKFFI